MKRKYTTELINEMLRLLDKDRNPLRESIGGWDDEPFTPEANEPGFDAGPDLGYHDGEEESLDAAPSDPEVTQLINKIRQIALQGIAKLANNPSSLQYDALKKVWQIIDKTVETNEPTAKNNSNR